MSNLASSSSFLADGTVPFVWAWGRNVYNVAGFGDEVKHASTPSRVDSNELLKGAGIYETWLSGVVGVGRGGGMWSQPQPLPAQEPVQPWWRCGWMRHGQPGSPGLSQPTCRCRRYAGGGGHLVGGLSLHPHWLLDSFRVLGRSQVPARPSRVSFVAPITAWRWTSMVSSMRRGCVGVTRLG